MEPALTLLAIDATPTNAQEQGVTHVDLSCFVLITPKMVCFWGLRTRVTGASTRKTSWAVSKQGSTDEAVGEGSTPSP